VEQSNEQPVILFKHSTRCGISSAAKFRLESAWDFSADEAQLYYLDLLAYRPISNAITERFGVFHQSPQVIVISKGKAVYDSSHHSINVADLRKAIGAL